MLNARTSRIAAAGSSSASSAAAARAVGADQRTRALDELEQLLALLAHERAAEQSAELADVAAQAGVALSRGRAIAATAGVRGEVGEEREGDDEPLEAVDVLVPVSHITA